MINSKILEIIIEKDIAFAIIDGKYDDLPENAFYMVGNIDEAIAKAEGMK